MDTYLDDHEQAEAIKRWWREYGRAVITGVLLGLVVLFGTRAWFKHRHEQAQAASMVYAGLMQGLQSGADDQILADADKLRKEFASTPYAALGALAQAKIEVQKGDLKAAAADLRWALDHADQAGTQHIARLRLARVRLAQGKADEALKLLGEAKPGTFVASYAEIEGDAYLAKDEPAKARTAYQRAIAALAPGARLRQLLQMKLDNLASTVGPQQPAASPQGSESKAPQSEGQTSSDRPAGANASAEGAVAK
ncbi:MAG: tetratricopeptide repeat protein [Gammaproteobacteria bacterium]